MVSVIRRFARQTTPLIPILFAASALNSAQVPQSDLAVQISAPSVLPGAMAQIRLTLASPHQIVSGNLAMDLDPNVFGPIAAVDVFSATGDQFGVANLRGRHVDAVFYSLAGGIGRLPGMPAITVSVPVLASAKLDAVASIALTAAVAPWKDVQGNQYVPVARPGQFKVGGNLSINSVTPGGGLLSAGTSVRIDGRGFTPSTTVSIEGVVPGATAFVELQTIDFTLGAPADLTGKRVVVRNAEGSLADFYPALRSNIKETSPGLVIQPIFPLRTYPGTSIGRWGTWFALQNQNLEPVEVAFVSHTQSWYDGSNRLSSSSFTVPAGELYMTAPSVISGSTVIDWSLYPSKPIRMMRLGIPALLFGAEIVEDEFPSLVDSRFPSLSFFWQNGPPACTEDTPPFPTVTSSPICVTWLLGSPSPKPWLLTVNSSLPTTFAVTVSTADGGGWLSASPATGTTCFSGANSCPNSQVALSVNPLAVAPGDYKAVLTVTAGSSLIAPQTIPLEFHVTNSVISVQGPLIPTFFTNSDGTPPAPLTLQVTSSGDPPRSPFRCAISRIPGSGCQSPRPKASRRRP